jgi:ABC-type glycerol-3-phosphate transport system substrate-binding protein
MSGLRLSSSTRRLAALAGLVIAVAACSGNQSATSPPTSGAPVTIKIQDFSVEQVEFHKQVAAEYHRLNPNVTLQWESIAQAQYNQTLPLAFQSQQAPDVFYWTTGGPQSMANLMASGWIKPLSPDGKVPDDWIKRWPAGSFQNGINMKDGKVYGFPWQDAHYWGPGYMYMNKAVFKDAGLDPTKPPTTWSGLADTCKTIKAKTKAYCLAVPMKGADFQRTWYALAAGNMTDLFFDYKNGRFDLDDPKQIETFNYVQTLYKAGYIAPGVQDKDFSRQQFAAGQAGIYMDGPWMVSVWQQLGFTSDGYTVAGHPNPDAGAKGALSSRNAQNAYWVSSQAKNPAEIWKLLQWVTNPGGFFVQNFLKNQFATLTFADNKKFLTDPAWKQIFKVGDGKGFRVNYPEPLLKCPALADSKAMTMASSVLPVTREHEVMVGALTGNKDVTADARAVASTRQNTFETQLQKEQAAGLKVSRDCFTFSNWNYDQSYDPNNYPKS